MILTLVRTFLVYAALICAVRMMGKRQIGELQPGELVITILISEIAAVPLEDTDIPLLNALASVAFLAALEVLMSIICVKNVRARSLLQGNSVVIIRRGKLDQKQLKRLRYTVDDILEALREKGVFSIDEVEYAVVETNGTLSVMPKAGKGHVTPEDLKIEKKNPALPCIVVEDGRIKQGDFQECSLTMKKLEEILRGYSVAAKDVVLLTADADGKIIVIKKEGDQK